jgi:hypothetical protein
MRPTELDTASCESRDRPMNFRPASNDRPRRWVQYLQCLGVAITAGLVTTFFFCPRFGNWKGVVLTNGPIGTDYGRAVATFHQIENPWEPIFFPVHKIIAWRLLIPLTWHYLKLPFWLFLIMPHIGCVITLWLTALLTQKQFDNWIYTWFAVALFAALPWFFVSTGWLGYFDSWLALGMLTVSFVPSPWALACACLLTPWIDERFILALPLCMIVRAIILQGVGLRLSRKLVLDSIVVASISLVYPAIRIIAWQLGDPLAPSYISAHLDELHRVPWAQFFDGLWSGYRAAWIVILAGIYFTWRTNWKFGVVLLIAVAVSAVGTLFIAADMSRSTMIILPALLVGVWSWKDAQPQSFKIALPAVLLANFLLPAAHVMWNLRIPIHYYPTVSAEGVPPYLDPQEYIQHGEVSLAEGKVDETSFAIRTALSLDDRFAPAYVLRASLRFQQNDIMGASDDVATALKLAPNLPDGLFAKGIIAARLNDALSAKSDIEKALQNAPPDWRRREQATNLLEQLDRSLKNEKQ